MKLFQMKCKSCGREFECDGHCANISYSFALDEWDNLSDKQREEIQKDRREWKSPKVSMCTCDNCKNRLIDKHGKPCNNHCEPINIKVEFT